MRSHIQNTVRAGELGGAAGRKAGGSRGQGGGGLSFDVERHLFDGFDCAEQLGECGEPYPEYCAGR